MMALALVALSAGFLGSVHCVFMCGGMSAAAASTGRGTARRIALYQVGRTGSYAVIGALAGLAGSAVDVAGSAVGVSRVAVVLAAVVLVVSGVVTLLEVAGVQVASPGRPGVGQRVSAFVGRQNHLGIWLQPASLWDSYLRTAWPKRSAASEPTRS